VALQRKGAGRALVVVIFTLAVSFVSFLAGRSSSREGYASMISSQIETAAECARPLTNSTAALLSERAEKPKTEHERHFRMGRGDTIAERTFTTRIEQPARFIASPSIVELPSGRLLLAYEKQASWGVRAPETVFKVIDASDDGGVTWQHMAKPGPMHWPSIFRCVSGVYLIGVQKHFTPDNQVVITKMLDEGGTKWSPPVILTRGFSSVMANTGVDVSFGRVTKAFEIIPVNGRPVKESTIISDVTLRVFMGKQRYSWHSPPRVNMTVQDSGGFIADTLVKVVFKPHDIFFRIVGLHHPTNTLELRMEKFTLFWITEDITIPAGSKLKVGSGANIYGGVDWVSMTMSADETRDLRDPQAWTYTEPLGNPASTRVQAMASLLDVAFRPDHAVRKSIIGFAHKFVPDYHTAVDAGFGSIYWMEGVVVRLQDRRGSSGQLLVTLRVNNDLACDLAALVAVDDSSLRPQPDGAAPVVEHLRNRLGRRRRRHQRRRLQHFRASSTPDRTQQSVTVTASPLTPDASSDEDEISSRASDEAFQQGSETVGTPGARLGSEGEVANDLAASSSEAGRLRDEAASSLARSRFARRLAQSDGKQPRAPLPEAKKAGKVHSGLTAGVPEGTLERRFLRFKNVPGLGIGHPAILYDNVTDLYWMASNMNRDSTRVWRQPWQKTLKKLHITPFSHCEVDRTTMGLFYSGNAVDWWTAGVIDYHLDFAAHFTYPHMIVNDNGLGPDLLVVMRATAPPANASSPTAGFYNNHNSNAISFHRVRNFRQLANVQWATWEGEYTLRPRAMSSDL